MSMTPEENRARMAEQKRRYREANPEKHADQKRRYREANKGKQDDQNRRYREANKEKVAEQTRRRHRRKVFLKEDGSSFQAWLASLKNPASIFIAIANLVPHPGQTLAELIHELSGYAMEVCEQIANPPLIEDTKEPPTIIEDGPTLTPAPAPDLF